jgi:hypothetical protein
LASFFKKKISITCYYTQYHLSVKPIPGYYGWLIIIRPAILILYMTPL